jgi:hypothetical protein
MPYQQQAKMKVQMKPGIFFVSGVHLSADSKKFIHTSIILIIISTVEAFQKICTTGLFYLLFRN